MSAPPAPLTPADITALLGDGWEHTPSGKGEWSHHMWLKSGKAVELYRRVVRIWASLDANPLVLPATRLFVVPNLTLAGLIPGQVSVTQAREPRVWNAGDPEPTDVRKVVDTHGQEWEKAVFDWYHTDSTGRWRAPWTAINEGTLTEVVDR